MVLYIIVNSILLKQALKFASEMNGDLMRISDQVTIRLFFDRVVNSPKVSRSYRTTNTSFGFSVRFELVK